MLAAFGAWTPPRAWATVRACGLACLLSLTLSACTSSYSAAEIEAWVIDADSKQPIEGVHVLARWLVHFGMEGGSNEAVMVMESVTDANGRFYFPAWEGMRHPENVPRMAHMRGRDPEIVFFKSGYLPRSVYNPSTLADGPFQLPRTRTSDWHRGTIEMTRLPPEDPYGRAQQYGILLTGMLAGRGWWGCGWQRFPRFMWAVMEEGKRLDAANVMHEIPTEERLNEMAAEWGCATIRQIIEGA